MLQQRLNCENTVYWNSSVRPRYNSQTMLVKYLRSAYSNVWSFGKVIQYWLTNGTSNNVWQAMLRSLPNGETLYLTRLFQCFTNNVLMSNEGLTKIKIKLRVLTRSSIIAVNLLNCCMLMENSSEIIVIWRPSDIEWSCIVEYLTACISHNKKYQQLTIITNWDLWR